LRKFLREVLMVIFFIPLNKNFPHYTLPLQDLQRPKVGMANAAGLL